MFDRGRFSEVHSGNAMTYAEAYAAVLQQARDVRAAREADLMPYCVISVGQRPHDEVAISIPLKDLALDDSALIQRIETETATQHRRREEYEAQLRPGAPSAGGARYDTVSSSVGAQLDRVTALVTRGDLESVQSSESAAGSRVDREQHRVSGPFEWPSELVELSSVDTPIVRLTPWGPLYSADQMVAARTLLIEHRRASLALNEPDDDQFQGAVSDTEPAGTQAFAFLDGFVPIAGDDEDYLVVDVRAGDLHGCVTVYHREGDSPGALWVSVSAMLSDLADSIELGAVFHSVWVPAITGDGRVQWDAP